MFRFGSDSPQKGNLHDFVPLYSFLEFTLQVNRDLYLGRLLKTFLFCSAFAPEVAFTEGFDHIEVHDFVPLYGFYSSVTATISLLFA